MNGGDKHLEDCYYYLHTNCKKGPDCIFRHSAEAKMSTRLCPEWEQTRRCTVDCSLRHSTYQVQRKKADEYCYFEDKEQGCTKPFCEFRHRNPDKDAWKLVGSQSEFSGDPSSLTMQGGGANGRERSYLHSTQFFGSNSSGTQDQDLCRRYDSFQQSETANGQPLLSSNFVTHQEYDLVDSDAGNQRFNDPSTPMPYGEASDHRHSESGSKTWLREGINHQTNEIDHPISKNLLERAPNHGHMDTPTPPFHGQFTSVLSDDQSRKTGIQRSNHIHDRPGFPDDSDKFCNEQNRKYHGNYPRLRDSADDDYKKAKTNGSNVADMEKKDTRLPKQDTQLLAKQDITQAGDFRDRSRNKRRERAAAIDRNKETRDKPVESLDSDRSYFKRIRMENKTLLNEIEDVERELGEIECRISHAD